MESTFSVEPSGAAPQGRGTCTHVTRVCTHDWNPTWALALRSCDFRNSGTFASDIGEFSAFGSEASKFSEFVSAFAKFAHLR